MKIKLKKDENNCFMNKQNRTNVSFGHVLVRIVYDVAFIQHITSCNINRIIRVIIIWCLHLTSLTITVSNAFS